MFYTTYAYGHDFGNTETTGATQTRTGDRVLTLSSALYRGSYEELMRIVGATSTNDGETSILNAGSHAIRFRDQDRNERELFVGELAIKQAGNTTMDVLTGRGQMQRYWDYRSLALLLVTSGTLIPDGEYGLTVVTNIPVASHTEINTRRVKAALEGHHEFTLDGKKRTAHVTVKKIIMEGASANILYGDGKRKIGVIDIGGRTTDAYMVDGLAPVQDLCKSFDVGVETASDRIKDRFEAEFDFPISVQDTQTLIGEYVGAKRYQDIPSVSNSGRSDIHVERLVHQIVREVGQDITNRIRGVWNQSFKSGAVAGDVSTIIAIGGGAYYFGEALASLFDRRLTVPARPERINALGCFQLAKHYQQRDTAVQKVVG
jgi:hypothetical protein